MFFTFGPLAFKLHFNPHLKSVQAAYLHEFIFGSLLPPVAARGENKLRLSWLDMSVTESCDFFSSFVVE